MLTVDVNVTVNIHVATVQIATCTLVAAGDSPDGNTGHISRKLADTVNEGSLGHGRHECRAGKHELESALDGLVSRAEERNAAVRGFHDLLIVAVSSDIHGTLGQLNDEVVRCTDRNDDVLTGLCRNDIATADLDGRAGVGPVVNDAGASRKIHRCLDDVAVGRGSIRKVVPVLTLRLAGSNIADPDT